MKPRMKRSNISNIRLKERVPGGVLRADATRNNLNSYFGDLCFGSHKKRVSSE